MSDRKLDAVDITYYAEPPSYQHFLAEHLLKNEPALIGPALTASWRARTEWAQPIKKTTTRDHDNHNPTTEPNFQFLFQTFGAAQVQVADCLERDFTDQKRGNMTFAQFIEMWQSNAEESAGRYYLKDWHFVKAFPDYHAYEVPDIFEDDWMNEYWPSRDEEDPDDYRFVYMGGDGTFTPFHADVYRSYSWSSNICGVKRWTLFPPGQEHLFKDKFGNNVYDIRDVDEKKFPRFSEAKRVVIYQVDGTTLFVPSGWWHQVENIGATISINHNWNNACNLKMMSKSLGSDLAEVCHTISDVKDMMDALEFEQTCQRILLINSGWNWETLWGMFACIMERLKQDLDAHSPCENRPPVKFSLNAIREVVDYWSRFPALKTVFKAADNQDLQVVDKLLIDIEHKLKKMSSMAS
ncbi:hypothetical protein K450DRAFT_170813 [Umbelopsis ramanniana AG]|uniref:JmjC domain-containing protein n=1 Tax=Umbelopsis ramanniana AG TaxID=1314678 RepID=A0AAD5EFI8_UMBRA|nr:uncharacterized protein K450DRAFT_170813 [Umbelopsis ramanniana AG]KAI8582534.1 hypothetical protein K450DRAFT_170813 [Umbelopsis ramanniana AG]